ncbi:MAG: T9SS type A sorting domain-containing protein, partial [Ignavibacteriaceae bacterium]
QFLRSYLKAKFISDDSNNSGVYGADSTAFAGLGFSYGIISQGSPYIEDYPDVIDTTGGSISILAYNGVQTAGIAYTGNFNNSQYIGQLIYIAFPFETIGLKTARTSVMTSALKYFGVLEATDIKENGEIPLSFTLEQNYPNPFNPSTKIKYSIPNVETHSNASVQLKVYDILGNEIATLVNKQQQQGNYEVNFDASKLASGVYIYKLNAGSFISSKKMTLLK